jgi:hypothetical protein
MAGEKRNKRTGWRRNPNNDLIVQWDDNEHCRIENFLSWGFGEEVHCVTVGLSVGDFFILFFIL